MSTFNPAAWNDTEASTGSYGENWQPPAGTYEVAIEKAETFESGPNSKAPGTPYIRMEYTIQGGDLNGRSWSEIRGLSDRQIEVQKAHCLALGVDPTVDSLEQLDERLRAVVGSYRTVKVTKSGRFTNTNVQAAAGQVAADIPGDASDFRPAPAVAVTTPVDDDDIPFLWDGPVDHPDRYHSNR